ncbi:MAG: phosphotransferase, partial [Myxococcales bacterium]|nr:phosphotransferase [Myxococcales bacterium]
MRAYLDLTNRGQAQRIRLLARQAVEAFGLVDARLDLLDHAENTTFRVTAPQGRYVLRVHRPGYRSPAEIQSELWWLDALTREAGLRVPRPQRTPDGRWLVQCQVPGVPEPRDCVLFEWLDGR